MVRRRLGRDIGQPGVAGVDEGNRYPEPLAPRAAEEGEKRQEVGFVLRALLHGLKAEVSGGLVEA